MINKFVYKIIASKWDSTKKIYAKYKNIKDRLKLLDKYVGVFKDSTVVEIGSNAGIAAFSIMSVAKSYIGIEPEPHYVEQADIAKEFILKKKNVVFYNGKIMNLPETDYNALYASYSLYHLNDTEVEYLVSTVFPKCDVVIVINRANQRKFDKNKYQLWYYKNTIDLLQLCGFKTSLEWGNKKKSFYIVVGKK